MAKKKSKASAAIKPKIVQSGQDRFNNHRLDITSCPRCSAVRTWEDWNKCASVLILEPYSYRAGSVAVMSECSKCFELSWTHVDYGCFRFADSWPIGWAEAVKKTEDAVRLKALRDWGAGICHGCKHLKSGEVRFHAWRACIIGSGPAVTSCDKYKPQITTKG